MPVDIFFGNLNTDKIMHDRAGRLLPYSAWQYLNLERDQSRFEFKVVKRQHRTVQLSGAGTQLSQT